MRIAIGGISHETSTFVKTPTTLKDFESGFGLFRGAAVIERHVASVATVTVEPPGNREFAATPPGP